MKHLSMIMLGLTISITCHASTDASTEEERRYLIKIAQDLAHLDTLALKAANQADPHARVTLDYVALRHDLQEMRRALVDHISKPSRSPRAIKPLEMTGDK